jgi:peroxiredoxin
MFKQKTITMKRSLILLVFTLTIGVGSAQNTQITLDIEGMASKSVLFEHVSDKATQIFSGNTDANGRLTMYLTLSEYGFYRINLNQGKEVFFIVTGPGDKITFTSNAENLHRNMIVEGSPANAKYLQVKYQNDSIKLLQSQLEKEHKQLSTVPGNEQNLKNIVDRYGVLQAQRLGIIKQYMSENSESLTVLFFTEEIKQDDEPLLYDKIVGSLMKKHPGNFFVQDLNRKVSVDKITRIGSIAPDIALPTPDGDTIRLSDLRGKVVLLDFWAAWCGPCRRENPNLVRIYSEYKDKGFEIYGVSLDRDRASWMKGIAEDKLTWTLVSDLKYWSSDAAKLYGVTSIPYAVLLDREGRIIAKKIRAHELEKILGELFAAEGK